MKLNPKLTVIPLILTILFFSFNASATTISPFTGLAVSPSALKSPVMAVVDNLEAAKPQAGLEKAAIVYEFPVEGGITRFLALFYDQLPNRIGPIRSARTYLLEKAFEYNASLLHSGSSPQGYEYMSFKNIVTWDEFYNDPLYWRDTERRAPHNLYTGWPNLQKKLTELPSKNLVARFPFLEMSIYTDQQGAKGNEVTISFAKNNEIYYKYLPWSGHYERYVNNKLHFTDSGQPLRADNLILQYVDVKVIDSIGRLEMSLEGRGRAIIFRDGQAFEGSWLKTGPGWTSFLDRQGRLINFNPGTTWVEIVPTNREVRYQ